MKMHSVFEEILYDKMIKEENDKSNANKENTLKIFYNTDIRLTRSGEEGEEGVSYMQNSKGEVPVKEKDVENIQNLHNLIDYSTNLIENGKPIINELVANIIKIVSAEGTDRLEEEELVQKEDKIIIDIDYGFEKEDSIGIKLNKTSGSDLVSFVMKKDGKILAGDFKMDIFEQQLLTIRNRLMEKE